MHSGSITGNTAAARVYRVLSSPPGRWWSGWDLTLQAQVTAVGTRVSEIRHQLPNDQRIETQQRGRKWFYRLHTERQMRLF